MSVRLAHNKRLKRRRACRVTASSEIDKSDRVTILSRSDCSKDSSSENGFSGISVIPMTSMDPRRISNLPFTLQQISRRVYVASEPDGGANAGIILGARGPIVVDSLRSPSSGQTLLERVQELSHLPTRALLYTHHHGDHTFGGQAFECAVISHVSTARALRTVSARSDSSGSLELFYGPIISRAIQAGRKDTLSLFKRFQALDLCSLRLRAPDVTFSERLSLQDPDGPVEIFHLGHCHSVGDAAVLVPDEGVLFAGDLVFVGRIPFMTEPIGPDMFRAFEVLEQSGAGIIVPGHGRAGGVEIIRAMREFFRDLLDAVKSLRDKGKTLTEIKSDIDIQKYAKWPRYQAALPLNAEMVFLGLEQASDPSG